MGRSLTDRVVQTAQSLLRRVFSSEDASAEPTEWDNDVPPFPVFAGEVARAELSVPAPTRPRRRSMAV
jgi:hypothetical protein